MFDRASNGLHARRVYGLIRLTDRPIPGLIPPACPEAPILGQGWDGVMQGRCGAISLSYGSGRCGWLRSRGTHHDSEWAALTSVAATLGVAPAEAVRKGVRQAEIDAGVRVGVNSQESAHRDGDDLWRN
jgi:hypothetical protein